MYHTFWDVVSRKRINHHRLPDMGTRQLGLILSIIKVRILIAYKLFFLTLRLQEFISQPNFLWNTCRQSESALSIAFSSVDKRTLIELLCRTTI